MSHLNVGNLDRVLRVVLGLGLISLAAAGIIGPWGYAGIVPLLTGLSARCPLYSVFGIATTSRLMAAFALASTLGLWLAQRLWSSLRGAGRGERFAA